MYYVYILKSLKFKGKIYIGYTSDLKKRVGLHKAGSNNTTRNLRPLELVYYEAFKSKMDAHNREKQLKNYGNALGHLKKRIGRSLGVIKVR
jgi:putative endonuclease